MNKLKEVLSNLTSNKRRLITVLVIAIGVLAIPVGLQLVQQQQIFRSQAAGDDAAYRTPSDKGDAVKTVSQMRTEMQNAGWAGQDLSRPPKELFYLYIRNGVTGPGNRSMRCTVNKGDLSNMTSQVQAINPGDQVVISVVQKWEDEPSRIVQDFNKHDYVEHKQWKCNEWYPNVKFTNKTTGKVYDHLCSGPVPGAGPQQGQMVGWENKTYENHFNQDRPDEQNPGLYSTFDPLQQVKSCTATVPEAGEYQVEIFYTDRKDPGEFSCDTGGGVRSFCGFITGQGAQGGPSTPGGGGGSGGNNPAASGNVGIGSGSGYPVSGIIKDASGNPVAGIKVEVYNDRGGSEAKMRSVTTDSNGRYSVSDVVEPSRLYAVRLPDRNATASNNDRSFVACNNENRNAYPSDRGYECQFAGSNQDCKDRCDFKADAGAGGSGTGTGACTLGAGRNECPLPSTVSYPNGTASCDSSNRVTFSWSAMNYPGKTVASYELRINAAPAAWGPDTSTPASQVPANIDPSVGPDRVITVPASQTSIAVQMPAGQGLDWVARPRFTDGTIMNYDTPGNWGHWGGWTCPGAGGGTGASPSPSAAAPTVVTETVKIVEDNTRNTIPENDPIWDDVTIVTEKPYTEVSGKKLPFTLRDLVCVTTPCDPTPAGDRWVHVLFIGKDNAGNVVKKSESKNIYLALAPKVDAITCDIAASGGTTVKIDGSRFGSTVGSVKLGNQNAQPANITWTNTTVTANISSAAAGNEDVVLTTPEGQSVTSKCTLGKSQVDFTASLACRSVSKALTTASIEIKEAVGVGTTATTTAGNSVFKQPTVGFDSSGKAQNVLPQLTEGKDYIMSIQAPSSLKKNISFKAGKGTTVLQAFDLPLGDIDPERTDCKINSLDIRRLYAEWASNSDASNRRADLNQDGRVNSIDYACMRSNFDKVCDSP
jgi:hypothetical protein